MSRHLKAAFVAALGGALVASIASATPPGTNGRIAFRRYFDQTHSWGAVFTINADGTGEQQVTHPRKGTVDDQPDWSPDGTKIAFERCHQRCEVWVVNADGTGLARIGPACDRVPLPKCEDRSAPAWSPDGRAIAFDRAWGPGGHGAIKFSASSVLSLKGGGVRQLIVSKPYGGDVGNAMWSPDGKRLVLDVKHDAPLSDKPKGLAALFTINADATGLHQLTPWALDASDHPDWSPDGKWILFRSYADVENKQSQIYLIHPDGTGLKQLTHFKQGSIVTSSSFSPDDKWIVYATDGVGGNADLFVMHPNGTGQRPITRTKLWDSAPDWGPATR